MKLSSEPFILLADDDPEDQEMLREALEELAPGLTIISAWNGQQALSLLAKYPEGGLPGLLILDYKMPVLNGSEVLSRLSRESRYASMQKVIWSTSGQSEHMEICLQFGASAYYRKPNSVSELKVIVAQMISLFRGAGSASTDKG